MAGLTTAEKNKRKRERKKRERDEQRLRDERDAQLLEQQQQQSTRNERDNDVQIDYVPEPVAIVPPGDFVSVKQQRDQDGATATESDGQEEKRSEAPQQEMADVLRRFQSRASVQVSDDDDNVVAKEAPILDSSSDSHSDGDDDGDDDGERPKLSNRKSREKSRPTVAELKTRVKRADLVEAHDVTAADPVFLLHLKSVPGTVPVPKHWGRKRKYLQGKRGIEKAPFQLPAFIVKTGITQIRTAVEEDEAKMSAKQKNRGRVAPKMGALDVDYRTLHDAFFKHQTKPASMTKFGDLYYEGKEFETQKSSDLTLGVLSPVLREALGMTSDTSPPPWLINMQRYGPPPSYPNLRIPGLNAPIPEGASYGYHANGWGKPPVDAFGRPLYGGNPFGPPGSGTSGGTVNDGGQDSISGPVITSDGKTIGRKAWGALPMAEAEEEEEEDAQDEDEESEEEESSGEEMAQSEGEEGVGEDGEDGSTVPADGVESVVPASALDLRKQPGDETPLQQPVKQLYTVLQQTVADKDQQKGAVFASDVQYVLPGVLAAAAADTTEGATSVLSKALKDDVATKRKLLAEEDRQEDADLAKRFKF